MAMKLHMRGAQNFYYFGVPEYVVMIEILYPRGTSYGRITTQMKSFYDATDFVFDIIAQERDYSSGY
jgi:hypothetical protein